MLKFELVDAQGFSIARLEGLVSLDAWATVLAELRTALGARNAPPRLVIDMNAVLGYLGVPERQAVGGLMARHLAGMQKVAIVVHAAKITNVVHDEAQRNGLNLRLFPRSEDAQAWICA
jgi:hypothetical protein